MTYPSSRVSWSVFVDGSAKMNANTIQKMKNPAIATLIAHAASGD